MAFVRTFGQGVAVRFLLGVAEAGVFPGFALYLSRWYRKDELGFRLALYIVCAPLAGAFGGLLASGLLKLEGFGMVRSWRIIFFVEGIITMGIAVISWFVLPNGPETARWLSSQEKALAAVRIKSENVGSLEVVDGIHRGVIRTAMFNPTTLVISLIVSRHRESMIHVRDTDLRRRRRSFFSTTSPFKVGRTFIPSLPHLARAAS